MQWGTQVIYLKQNYAPYADPRPLPKIATDGGIRDFVTGDMSLCRIISQYYSLDAILYMKWGTVHGKIKQKINLGRGY